ncbi:AMP-binding protein [Salinibacter grassmerensis]|uniref:AMP-binding protein n=1 Tax=Salinibacter grassmerensis TaxID=3040353 RepID=UPI0021E71135|nr:class I adenylate-forming enzyme family protein [Salinibacter grassmerensis]
MQATAPPSRSGSAARPSPAAPTGVVADLQAALAQCPADGMATDENPWQELFYEHLRDEGLPAFVKNDAVTPAGSLWTGARRWTESFREASLQAGDRLVVSLPPSTAFIQVLIAALWEGLTIAVVPPDEDINGVGSALDARGAIASEPGSYRWTANPYAGPASGPDALRPAETPPTPDVRFLLRTSGTTQLARWIALSDRNVLSVLASHLPHLTLRRARVLSVLPWSHVFGLVLDLLPALLAGAEIIRDPDGGRDPASLASLGEAWGATHLSAVPLTIQRLLDTDQGPALLRRLHGGIVGGAPVSGPLADRLAETQLRAGYGQTEAAPGIALGAPGEWAAHYLGRPLGCQVRVAEDGELLFEGPNAHVGVWRRHEGLERRAPARTVRTGDLVRREGEDFFFEGRKDTAFKLSNGRFVQAGTWEARLKSEFPGLHDALLFTPAGTDIAVALCVDPSASKEPSEAAIRDVLGRLGHRLAGCIQVAPQNWSQGNKGTVDRDEMTRRLRASHFRD